MLRVDDEPFVKPMEYNLPDEEFDALLFQIIIKDFYQSRRY